MPQVTNPNLLNILNSQAQPLQPPANTNTPAPQGAQPGFTLVPVDKSPPVPSGYKMNDDGTMSPVEGGPADPEATIDDATATFYAEQMLAGGQMPALGMGKAAAKARQDIMNKVAALAGARGLRGEDLARQVAHYKAGSAQLRTLETQLGTIRQAEQTALLNGQQFIDRSAELPGQTQMPLVNTLVQGAQRNLPVPGHDTISAMDAAYNTFYTEYAKVVAGSPSGAGVLSDSARHEAMETIRSNASLSQKKAAFEQMKKDMENRIKAIHSGINDAYKNLTQSPGYQVPESTASVPVPEKQDGGVDPSEVHFGDDPESMALPAGAVEMQKAFQGAFLNGQIQPSPESVQQWLTAYNQAHKTNFSVPDEQLGPAIEAMKKGIAPIINTPQFEKPDISDARGKGGDLETADAFVRNTADTAMAGIPSMLSAAADAVLTDRTFASSMARENEISKYDWQNHAIASTAGTVTGALLVPSRVTFAARNAARVALRSGATREAAVAAARKAAAVRLAGEGMAYGGVHGATSTTPGNLLDHVGQAAVEAVTGAATGATLPYVAKAGQAATNVVKSVFQRAPELAQKIVFKAIKADGNTADDLARKAGEAEDAGVPFMVGDSGENARGVLSASARAPGPGRAKAIDALDERQGGLADRVVSHIERDLGPIANPHKVADSLMTQASEAAGPLYEAAYAKSGADAFGKKVAPLLARPSMKRALANAYHIAEEEGRDPQSLGFDFNEAGDIILGKVPNWQTLDYVKRGMDDVVEGYRDKTTGRLVLDTQGRAVNNTLRDFIKAFDKANPDYAAARNAYAGPVRGVNAMNQGRKALTMTADDLEERMRGMTDYEREMFALGTRRAMAELAESKGDSANIVQALVGTGKKRAMLARLFGDREGFDRFVKTLDIENEAHQTFKRARTGAPTAPNVADDKELAVATGVADLATIGVPIMSALRLAARAKNNSTAKKAQDAIASMLGERDPAKVRELIAKYRKVEARLRAQRRIKGTDKAGAPVAVPLGVKAVPNEDDN